MGMGAPAIDVVCFVSSFFLWGNNDRQADDDADELKDYYYSRYIAHGGLKTDLKGWRQSCDLARVFYGLSLLPVYAGNALRRAKKQEKVAWVTREAERVTETIRRVFD